MTAVLLYTLKVETNVPLAMDKEAPSAVDKEAASAVDLEATAKAVAASVHAVAEGTLVEIHTSRSKHR